MNLFYCIAYQEAPHALNNHCHSKRFLFSPRGWGTGILAECSSVPQSTASKVVLLTFFYLFIFLVGRKLLCNVLLASAAQQCESAVSIHISPLSPASLPSAHPVPRGSGHHRAPDWAPCAISNFPPVTCVTRGSVHMLILLSPFVLASPFEILELVLSSTGQGSLLERGLRRAVRVKKKKSHFFQIMELEGTKNIV